MPGESLGGLRLGATKAQVERAWGRAYGRCTSCPQETWYFNYFAFQPRGAGVEFRDGRAVAIFTLYQPAGWQTTRGLALGEPESRVRALYPKLARRDCGDYDAFVSRRGAYGYGPLRPRRSALGLRALRAEAFRSAADSRATSGIASTIGTPRIGQRAA